MPTFAIRRIVRAELGRTVVVAAALGGLAAFVSALGFVPLYLSDDFDSVWVDAGFVVSAVGGVGLTFGLLALQIRTGLLAMRRAASSARFVLGATLGFCAGATLMFALVYVALTIAATTESIADHWADIPEAAAFFVPWLYGLVSAGVVILVTEAAHRAQTRRSSPRP